jgi:hypothetical protein
VNLSNSGTLCNSNACKVGRSSVNSASSLLPAFPFQQSFEIGIATGKQTACPAYSGPICVVIGGTPFGSRTLLFFSRLSLILLFNLHCTSSSPLNCRCCAARFEADILGYFHLTRSDLFPKTRLLFNLHAFRLPSLFSLHRETTSPRKSRSGAACL